MISHIPVDGRGNDYRKIKVTAENIRREKRVPSLPISIVIPVYNRKERLAKTLAGLVNQSYPNHLMEVIVADDGSSDGVEEVIRFFESHLKIKNHDVCKTCSGHGCLYFCPVGVYTMSADGKIQISYQSCIECGSCRIRCEKDNIEWKNPRGGFGVAYKFG